MLYNHAVLTYGAAKFAGNAMNSQAFVDVYVGEFRV
jgi:hypothetical protein